MNERCNKIRTRLLEHGLQKVCEDTIAATHIRDCEDCLAFAEALQEIDVALPQLPQHDVSDPIVSEILKQIAGMPMALHKHPKQNTKTTTSRLMYIMHWLCSLPKLLSTSLTNLIRQPLSSTVNSVVVILTFCILTSSLVALTVVSRLMFSGGKDFVAIGGYSYPNAFFEDSSTTQSVTQSVKKKALTDRGMAGIVNETSEKLVDKETAPNRKMANKTGEIVVQSFSRHGSDTSVTKRKKGKEIQDPRKLRPAFSANESFHEGIPQNLNRLNSRIALGIVTPKDVITDRPDINGPNGPVEETTDSLIEYDESLEISKYLELKKESELISREIGTSSPLSGKEPATFAEEAPIDSIHNMDETYNNQEPVIYAKTYLNRLHSLKDLHFQEAQGYWKNNYVPGDPHFRLLQHRLMGYDNSSLRSLSLRSLSSMGNIQNSNSPLDRKYDIPQNAALAVYMQADKNGIQDRNRMLLQIGLQATKRHSGNRPAMNVGLVFDLRGNISVDEMKSFRSLMFAFEKARDIGDRFSLTVAGRPGGTLIKPKNFRHGPIVVTSQQLFNRNVPKRTSTTHTQMSQNSIIPKTLTLQEALRESLSVVKRRDDPNAPLGSSVVILVTSKELSSHTRNIIEIARESAIDGVPFSTIGIGKHINANELNEIVLAGQGNRRFLRTPAQAAQLVKKELFATSRVVARAVRINIQLAPSVKLIDILKSKRLDKQRAQFIRRAEQSIDKRIAKNLGIQADRGKDDEGIQIIIPSFYSGDSHIILLDVVAESPGAIATTTIKYKDLAFLKNGVARAHLNVDRSEDSRNPLNKEVIKNRLVVDLITALDEAASAVRNHKYQTAATKLAQHATLLEGMKQLISEFENDSGINEDILLLNQYAAILQQQERILAQHNNYVADSMEFAAFRKYLPKPEFQQ